MFLDCILYILIPCDCTKYFSYEQPYRNRNDSNTKNGEACAAPSWIFLITIPISLDQPAVL